MRRSSVDLPAFGSPTRPTSARSLSERRSRRASPGRPGSAKSGAWRVAVANCALPRPPRPPRAATKRWPSSARSTRGRPEAGPSVSYTSVPTGTRASTPAPSRPWRRLPSPWAPRSPRSSGRKRRSSRVARLRSATRTTSPPRPPSPPSGPPRGTYFSRRKLTQPLPPAPATTETCVSSMNISVGFMEESPSHWESASALGLRLHQRHHATPGLAVLHHAVAAREARVVPGETHIAPGRDLGSDLPHQDRACTHALTTKHLDAPALPIAVAAVS